MEDEIIDFKQIMRSIVEADGPEILYDVQKTNALLMDYAPRQTRERKLIISALQEGVGKNLIKALGKDKQEQQLCKNHCVRWLIDEVSVTEGAAKFAVAVISFSIGIDSNGPIASSGKLKSIGSRVFEYCGKLSSFVLPSGVEKVGERAFQYCDGISSIILPQSIHEIGDYAFLGCSSLQTISMPEGVKRIGKAAFKDCSSLRKIIIQDNVEFIGEDAFTGCAGNMKVAIKNNSYVERYCRAHRITWNVL